MTNFEKTESLFQHRYEQNDKFNKFYHLLYTDLVYSEPASIKIEKGYEEKKASELTFKTKNSLYGYTNPTVTYTLTKDRKRLLRYEADKDANLSTKNSTVGEQVWYYYVDVLEFFENVEKFRVFQKGEEYLFYIEMDKNPISFEISLAFLKGSTLSSDSNETNRTSTTPSGIDAPPTPPGMDMPPSIPPLPGRPQTPGSMPPMPPSVPLPGRPAGV